MNEEKIREEKLDQTMIEDNIREWLQDHNADIISSADIEELAELLFNRFNLAIKKTRKEVLEEVEILIPKCQKDDGMIMHTDVRKDGTEIQRAYPHKKGNIIKSKFIKEIQKLKSEKSKGVTA